MYTIDMLIIWLRFLTMKLHRVLCIQILQIEWRQGDNCIQTVYKYGLPQCSLSIIVYNLLEIKRDRRHHLLWLNQELNILYTNIVTSHADAGINVYKLYTNTSYPNIVWRLLYTITTEWMLVWIVIQSDWIGAWILCIRLYQYRMQAEGFLYTNRPLVVYKSKISQCCTAICVYKYPELPISLPNSHCETDQANQR